MVKHKNKKQAMRPNAEAEAECIGETTTSKKSCSVVKCKDSLSAMQTETQPKGNKITILTNTSDPVLSAPGPFRNIANNNAHVTNTDSSRSHCNSTLSSKLIFQEEQEQLKLKMEYNLQQIEEGVIQSPESMAKDFKEMIRRKLFRKCKFITSDEMLDWGGIIADYVLDTLKLGGDARRRDYWTKHRKFVNAALAHKRGTVNAMMKDDFMSK
jgi:hypothetical protein